jgi:hypothetical protein
MRIAKDFPRDAVVVGVDLGGRPARVAAGDNGVVNAHADPVVAEGSVNEGGERVAFGPPEGGALGPGEGAKRVLIGALQGGCVGGRRGGAGDEAEGERGWRGGGVAGAKRKPRARAGAG